MHPQPETTISTGLRVAIKACYDNSESHGFWHDYDEMIALLVIHGTENQRTKYFLDTRLHKIALMVSELGEAIEGIRKPHPDEHCPNHSSEAVELADCIIRIFDYCGAFNIDLASALIDKMDYNASRPYMHGKGA
jgi:NTP pyrophosphatase (non-canonical NTP hydrolase)